MPQKPVNGPVKPLEPWCAGSQLPVGRPPRNRHVKCRLCGRIVSILDGKLRHHRNIPLENRNVISEVEVP